MDKESLFDKIKSKYIFQNLLSYINDKEIFLKLFIYSKSLQEKTNIILFDYQEEYFNKRIKWEDFLYFKRDFYSDYSFHKDGLKNNLRKKMMEFNINDNIIQKLVIKYFTKDTNKNQKDQYIDDNLQNIDFYSPFFDFLSKLEIFDLIFTIHISIKMIKKYNLSKYYISKFNELNKLNIKYSSLSLFFEGSDIANYLQEFKINFSQIKKLDIFQNNIGSSNDDIYKKLFPLISTANNLVYLSLSLCGFHAKGEIGPHILEFINNFKSLEYLNIKGFKFYKNFILKVNTLKTLKVSYCKKILFSKDLCLN